jgi:hypothetical protein
MFAPATRRPARRTAFTFVVAAATLALFACGGGGSGAGDDISGPADPPSDNIYGTWFLVSVSGEPVPARINQFYDSQLDLTVKAELVNGHVTLMQDQTFEFAFVTRATAGSFVGPDIPIPAEGALQGGTWIREGNVLHRVRGPGQPADSLVLTAGGRLEWVVPFPQGAPENTVMVGQTLTFIHDAPPE